MLLKDRYRHILNYFASHHPDAETELHYNNPFQLLVAVILSAQCTDKRVNLVTPALFSRFPDPETMAASSQDEIFTFIKSISYPNNKAKHLQAMAEMLVSEFNSIIPSSVEALQKLPGVGRKTANVISSVIYDQPEMAVDTHVFRVSARLGLTRNARNPLMAEKQLVKYIPREQISIAHHWLILHGRYICKARKPLCEKCPLTEWCLHYSRHHK